MCKREMLSFLLVIKLYQILILCYVINIQFYWFVIWDKLLLIIWVWMKNKMEQMSACSLEGLRICLEQVMVSSWTDGLYI